jgi:hypothetical protein
LRELALLAPNAPSPERAGLNILDVISSKLPLCCQMFGTKGQIGHKPGRQYATAAETHVC